MAPALALVLPLMLASPGACYLVTSGRIDVIPCNFDAAATDALRYAARDSPEAKARRAEQQRRDALRPSAQPPPVRAFARGTARRR